jgi:hypothetical protein
MTGLIFESIGLHYLQDSIAGGHVRIDRSAHELSMARYLHNEDGRNGVVTSLQTRAGKRQFVAFGDGFLLTPPTDRPAAKCDWKTLSTKQELSSCLVRNHRRMMVKLTEASLSDWVLGGSLYRPEPKCEHSPLHRTVCSQLPTVAPMATGLDSVSGDALLLQHGTLPQPPPPYSYESLSVSLSLDATGQATQMGLNMRFLDEMGQMAQWMHSWDISLLSTARRNNSEEAVLSLAHLFHWRISARFLANMGPFFHSGLRGFGDDVSYFMGLGAYGGLTVLPEGWTKIPLDVSLNYRAPMTLFDTRFRGFSTDAIRLEGHWIEISLGLAFL